MYKPPSPRIIPAKIFRKVLISNSSIGMLEGQHSQKVLLQIRWLGYFSSTQGCSSLYQSLDSFPLRQLRQRLSWNPALRVWADIPPLPLNIIHRHIPALRTFNFATKSLLFFLPFPFLATNRTGTGIWVLPMFAFIPPKLSVVHRPLNSHPPSNYLAGLLISYSIHRNCNCGRGITAYTALPHYRKRRYQQ